MKSDKYTPYHTTRTETSFTEGELRAAYTSKLESMSDEERERVMVIANGIVFKIKQRKCNMPFGLDSALQLLYILGTHLNEECPEGPAKK